MNKQLFAITLSLMFGICHAGTTINVKETTGETSKKHFFYIANNKVSFSDGQSTMIFDSRQKEMTAIDHKEKSYVNIDINKIEQMSAQANQMMQQMREKMEAQMQNLPPEQQEQFQSMMKQMGHGAIEIKKNTETVRPTGRSETISGLKCKIIEVYQSGIKESESCIVPISKIGISASDYQTLKQFFEYQGDMVKRFGGEEQNFNRYILDQNLMPIKIVKYKGQKVVSTSTFKVTDKKPPSGALSIPSGYKQQSIEFPGK